MCSKEAEEQEYVRAQGLIAILRDCRGESHFNVAELEFEVAQGMVL